MTSGSSAVGSPCSAAERPLRPPLADARMVRERLDALLLRQPGQHLARAAERVLLLGQRLDEAAAGLEEVGQLVHAQLPR